MADADPKTRSLSIEPDTSHYIYVTPFTIECGPDLKPSMVHKELLCTHSPYLRDLCATAQSYKEEISSLDSLCCELAISVQGGNSASSNAERIKLLIKCYKHFPLPSTRDAMRTSIKNQTHAQMMNVKNLLGDAKAPLPPGDAIKVRLSILKPPSIKRIAEATLESLKKIQTTETTNATHDARKAAAQGKLLLPDTSPLAVQMLIHWMYTAKLADAAQVPALCELLALAVELRIAPLVQLVTGRLVAAIIAQIQGPIGGLGVVSAVVPRAADLPVASDGPPAVTQAASPDVPQTASPDPTIRNAPESTSNTPDVPFVALLRYTHTHAAAPQPLRRLVVETLAWVATPEDVSAAAQWLDRDMAMRLAIALAGRLKDAREGRVESGLVERLNEEDFGVEQSLIDKEKARKMEEDGYKNRVDG
ncbi:hypothetical protein AOQ84DRAFT_230688 [Glonium stellatum]|uniref:BTB domain-containing protein n=1 Tax=Glonium stellatum TaxID=574774 RepID=A0A8E2F533_9PEZI|nr:hypothetical protein AOQ84DRAFT_230688 [Glonium stellatum]